jgi:GNAT superfamily N-acetyltransferase
MISSTRWAVPTLQITTNPIHDAMTNPFTFRNELTPADPERIRSLVKSTGVFSPVEVDCAVELPEERLAKGPASGYHFVFAERDGQAHGYACYGPIALTVGSYDLYWIAVDKSCQGQGLGQLLLAEVEELVRREGGRRIYIETSTRPPYAPTRAFYLRCGYHLEVILADFYAVGDGKAIYAKVL